MLSFECTLDCIKKEHEKYFDPGMILEISPDDANNSPRPTSKGSTVRKGKFSSSPKKNKRLGTPE